MTLINRTEASHWYLRDGTPFHTVPKADGNGTRSTTLADARKVGAYPSVTNVLGILAKPALVAWQQEQAILSALTLPRIAGETDDAFAKRVVQDKDTQVEQAADLGTKIHDVCAEYALGAKAGDSAFRCDDKNVYELFRPFADWFDANVLEVGQVEAVVTSHAYGYAGRMDMTLKLKDIGWCVVDIKSQKVKRDAKGRAKPAFYETWPLQLSAYREAMYQCAAVREVCQIVSVVIDSVTPGPVHVKVWDDQSTDHTKAFHNALSLWKYIKEYDPTNYEH